MSKCHLIYDFREKLPKKIVETYHRPVEEQTLLVGDYRCSCGLVGFERKESDFTNMADVQRQVAELRQNYKFAFLVVNADLSKFLHEHARYYGMRVGFIAALCADGTVPLLVRNHYDMISIMYKIIDKIHDENRQLKEWNPVRHVKRKDRRMNVLTSFPGVGPVMADNLLNHFGTIRKVLTASAEKLMEVKGVGAKKAKLVREIIDG